MLFIFLCTLEDARGKVEEDSADVGYSSIQSTSQFPLYVSTQHDTFPKSNIIKGWELVCHLTRRPFARLARPC